VKRVSRKEKATSAPTDEMWDETTQLRRLADSIARCARVCKGVCSKGFFAHPRYTTPHLHPVLRLRAVLQALNTAHPTPPTRPFTHRPGNPNSLNPLSVRPGWRPRAGAASPPSSPLRSSPRRSKRRPQRRRPSPPCSARPSCSARRPRCSCRSRVRHITCTGSLAGSELAPTPRF
jgi:hypothetical protein